VFGVAASFYCHGFCSPHTLQHIYFFKRQEKNKRAASQTTEQKPTPKKLPEAK
jgi:hypothetical protein